MIDNEFDLKITFKDIKSRKSIKYFNQNTQNVVIFHPNEHINTI